MDSLLADGTPAWRAVREFAARVLADYIRIDTTNPPGNEKTAIEFLARILAEAGIEHEVLSKDPSRPNLIARLRGDGSRRPLILLHHADVVAADPAEWKVGPFSGETRDGAIWGRGAFDCKSLGVMHLVALLLAKEEGAPLSRDLVFICVSDEEQGGAFGARWLTETHPEKCAAEYLLGEGGAGLTAPGRPGVWLPSYAEKGILWLKLMSKGDAGHGSMPKKGGAVERMMRALSKLYKLRPQVFITEEAEQHLKTLSTRVKFPWKVLFRRPRSGLTRALVTAAARRNDFARALMSSTFSVSAVKAGAGENQIPASCEATLDCRIHPSDSATAFRRRVEDAARPEGVTVDVLLESDSTRSPVDTDLFRVMTDALGRHSTAKVAVPTLFPGTTDNRFFRNLGVTCYGISPVLVGLDEMDAHGPDEKITLLNLDLGCKVMHDIVSEMCGTGQRG
ncbi:MAG: M20/M25/M40 family metallo-hydrolase [Deltaproteobacteria bacterium]|nr:M20/M25/M40 family metallo-hydrolase [Deltaproteobacteria bacterium]